MSNSNQKVVDLIYFETIYIILSFANKFITEKLIYFKFLIFNLFNIYKFKLCSHVW